MDFVLSPIFPSSESDDCPASDNISKLLMTSSPEGLREVFTTGGLPPLVDNPQPVYERTYGWLFLQHLPALPALTQRRQSSGA